MRDPLGVLQRLAREHGDVVQFTLGRRVVVLLNDPELIRDVLVTSSAKFEKGVAGPIVKMFLGDSLLTSQGTAHHRQRRLVQPAFHRTRLASYGAITTEQTIRTAAAWRNGETRDMAEDMARLTLEVVGQTLFSCDIRSQSETVSHALSAFIANLGSMQIPGASWLLRLPLPFGYRVRTALKTLDSIVFELIRARRASGKDHGDLLSMLLMAEDADMLGGHFSDTEVRDQAMTLFLAGHETAAHALAWTWWLLAQNPDSEASLHRELAVVLGGRTPTLSDLPQLRYTESVVRESMRLYPPAWAAGRMTITTHELGSYRINPGTLVLVSQWVTHRDARYFPRPELFLPERWTPEFRESLPKYAYFPFGGGPRTCIGENFAWMELILIVAELAQRWKFRVVPQTRAVPQPRITLRPYGKLLLRFEQR